MFDISLMAGHSRGVTLLMRDAAAEAPDVRRTEDAEAATRADLIAALRFPLSPGWILQGGGRREALPRGCG